MPSTPSTSPAPQPSHSKRPSVRDVAALAEVSVGTVSHVLNHPDRVAPATRERVESAIASLGFVRSDAAHRLRAGESTLVGVVVHDISNPFFTEAARGIEDRLREAGCVPMLFSSDADPEREADIMRRLAGMDVRGVIVTPSAATLTTTGILTERGTRVVLMDSPPLSPDLPSVSVDDVTGARSAVAHLLSLGHRRIGLVNGPLCVRQAVDRRDGAVEAIDDAGLEVTEVLAEVEPDGVPAFSADAGAAGAAALLGSPKAPTALFCANDQLAIGAMREVRRRGLRIPEDVAIVGFDDVAVASELITPLTSVRQPMREIGRAAADLVLRTGPAGHADPAERTSTTRHAGATGRTDAGTTGHAGTTGRTAPAEHVAFTPELVVRASTEGFRDPEPPPSARLP